LLTLLAAVTFSRGPATEAGEYGTSTIRQSMRPGLTAIISRITGNSDAGFFITSLLDQFREVAKMGYA
jgi:hypothetical protein